MLVLRDTPRQPVPSEPDPGDQREPVAAPQGAIVCAACGGTITSARHRVAVNGAHDHRFMNPGGYLFHIGCFTEAVGCAIIGPASNEYPWFPGFLWRIAACAHCRVHLGWHFRSDDAQGFFGLILDRLRELAVDH
jgi:hypothetical protein